MSRLEIEKFVCCPCEKHAELEFVKGRYYCSQKNCVHQPGGLGFKAAREVPILVSKHNCDTAFDSNGKPPHEKKGRVRSWVFERTKIRQTNLKIDHVRQYLKHGSLDVLIVGSGSTTKFYQTNQYFGSHNIYATDICAYEGTDFIADAHFLPVKSESFDLIWIEAVLEHLIDPSLVVSEIHRVLRKDGIVFSEIPFLQHVHEGEYDFVRYTRAGHRYLFKNFAELESGINGGSFVVLSWAVAQAVWALFRIKLLGALVRHFLLNTVGRLDFISSASVNSDGCSGTYFIGRKSLNILTQRELIEVSKSYRSSRKDQIANLARKGSV